MANEPNDDWADPLPVVPYAARGGKRPVRRAFGNIFGNAGVGFVIFLISCFIGPLIASSMQARSPAAYLALPLTALACGVAAAFMPRYRGLLTGMLLLLIGVPLLIIGICFWK